MLRDIDSSLLHVMLCHLVSSLLGLYPEDGTSKILQNVSNYYSSCLRTIRPSLP